MNRLEEGALGNPVLAGKPHSSAPMALFSGLSKSGELAVIDSQGTRFRIGALARGCPEAEQHFFVVGKTRWVDSDRATT